MASPEKQDTKPRGLVIVHTGDGKGKTTAALGMAFRAVGHHMRVLVIQFIKGRWRTGEREAAKRFPGLLEIHPVGEGFTWNTQDPERDRRKVREGWNLMLEKLNTAPYDLLILDEINYAISYGYFPVEELLRFLENRPRHLHVVLTGRDAHPRVVEAADLVTEMRAVKHPFDKGIAGRKGIEF